MRIDPSLSPKDAIALQKELREQILLTPLTDPVSLIGGADVSMNRFAKDGFAGFITLSYPELSLVDESVVHSDIPFPYIPGLLSFREIPMLLNAWEGLRTKPEVLVVDGIGIAHPRRLGIASHLGLILSLPTIGCAKSVLVGTYEEPPNERGAYRHLTHQGEVIGAVVRTKVNVKPVFISPGHLITLEESIELVMDTNIKHRLPEPTRQAHNAVNRHRIAFMNGSGAPA